jgi:hypothetical protein
MNTCKCCGRELPTSKISLCDACQAHQDTSQAENKDLTITVFGVVYRGAGYGCTCGFESLTRAEMDEHRKTCGYNPEVYLRMREAQRYQEACERGKLDV